MLAAVAARAGLELLPWQRHAADVALELDDAGRYAWPEVGIVLARQNGKSALLRARIGLGLLLGERILHTAQNREIPRETFAAVAADLEGPLRPLLAEPVRRANGQELIRSTTGGWYRVLAPRPGAARGYAADLLLIDEAREHRTTDFVEAARPVLRTSRAPQTWYVSNAGDPSSVLLNTLRDRGRAGDDGLAWLEWSADPDLDLDDETAWVQANPALGYLFDLDTLRADYAARTSDEAWMTEALCRWVSVETTTAVPLSAWAALADPDLAAPAGRVWVAVDVDADREAAAVVVAWPAGDRLGVDLAASGDLDDDELVATVAGLASRYGLAGPVAYDPWTTSSVADRLAAQGVRVEAVTGRAWVEACGRLVERVRDGRLAHYGRAELAAQLAQAGRRETVEGRFWITRGDAPIPAATALARAVAAADRPRPVVAVHT